MFKVVIFETSIALICFCFVYKKNTLSPFRTVFQPSHSCSHSTHCFVLFPGLPWGLPGGAPAPLESFLRSFLKFIKIERVSRVPRVLRRAMRKFIRKTIFRNYAITRIYVQGYLLQPSSTFSTRLATDSRGGTP